MAGRGFIIAGGIIAIARGAIQAIASLPLLGNLQELDALAPGLGAVVIYESLMAVVLIIGGIFALVKSGSPASANMIKIVGNVVIALGAIDLIWAMAVAGSAAAASGLGSLIGCALAGVLLLVGAKKLGASAE